MSRVSTSQILVSFFWILLGWLQVQVWGFQMVPAVLGIALGVIVGAGFALRPLRIIGARGEYRTSRGERIAELAIFGGVVIALFWLVSTANASALKIVKAPIDSLALALDYVCPAWFGTRGVLFLAWETKNGKHVISEGSFGGRVYAVPKSSAH